MYIGILSLLGFGLGVSLLFLIGIALILIFEIYMFIHAVTNDSLKPERKLLWLVGMLIVHPFVAIAYYFTDFKTKLQP